MDNRILRAQNAWKALCQEHFTEKDLRGLSAKEKEFIRDHAYFRVITIDSVYSWIRGRYILYIDRNKNGRRQIYAMRKDQLIQSAKASTFFPRNGNTEVWLTFNWEWPHFNMYEAEIRISKTLNGWNPLL